MIDELALRKSLVTTVAVGLGVAGLLGACGSDDGPFGPTSTATATGGGGTAGSATGGGSGGEGATTTGGGGVGAAGGLGGEGGAFVPGEPIDAPAGQWTWVGFDDAFCADGSTTGIGINPGPADEMVVIYLQGGGACWDHQTCYDDPIAVHISDGYGADDFAGQAGLDGGPFSRTDLANPLAEASYVFVPYCTGDVHGGDRITDHGGVPTHHVGYANMRAFLRRVVPTFPQATRVVLSGGSAGGFGSVANFVQTAWAFGSARVDLVDDSGPWLPSPYLPDPLAQQFRSAWGIDANLPADCGACATDFDAIWPYLATHYPSSRLALLSYGVDGVVAQYFGITLTQFSQGLLALGPTFQAHDNLSYFVVGAQGHVMLHDGWGTIAQGGVTLRDWITAMVEDDAGWGDHPAP